VSREVSTKHTAHSTLAHSTQSAHTQKFLLCCPLPPWSMEITCKVDRPPMKRSASNTDAFSVLMEGKNKKRIRPSNNASRFVLCPAGCGKHVSEIAINAHLDLCMQHGLNQNPCSQPSSTPTAEVESDTQPKHMQVKKQALISPDTKPAESSDHSTKNAFAHMMERSSQVFSQKDPQKLSQRFHLTSDGLVLLTCYGSNPGLSQPENIQWTATAQVKDRTQKESPQVVEITVSSSIPSSTSTLPKRLVRRHTRLSVPVLKSILQKCIRRRRPLPAVRIAMELADKSLGDLLRRLPIIIFEDSTLHPDLPLLCWLMVAHSKDFEMTADLITKVMRVVFEMASCPWQDELETREEHSNTPEPALSICSFHEKGMDQTLDECNTIIWSTLLRAMYGGMSCDVSMLRSFAESWNQRFISNNVPAKIASLILPKSPPGTALKWRDVPSCIHQSVRIQSETRAAGLVRNGLSNLSISDFSIEGVDFHCSSILETVLGDRELVETCINRLGRIELFVPDDVENRRLWLEGILKKCMWTYSGGVNRRLPLMRKNNSNVEREDPLKDIWELIAPKAKAFAERYIHDRL
jgi:hypothetical protein